MGTDARNAVPIVYETQVLHLYVFTYVQSLDLEETTWLKGLACHLLPTRSSRFKPFNLFNLPQVSLSEGQPALDRTPRKQMIHLPPLSLSWWKESSE